MALRQPGVVMVRLWTPPGADFGEFDGPVPDPRMERFAGGFDADGVMRPMTYRRCREVADGWVITGATPEGPASLLRAARDMFALGFYAYELVACSNAWSIFAVEAALKLRLARAPGRQFQQLIAQAKSDGLVDDDTVDILNVGRELRNNFVHEGRQATWTLAMAGQVIGTSFLLVANLFPDLHKIGSAQPQSG